MSVKMLLAKASLVKVLSEKKIGREESTKCRSVQE
jgi:hypothetical protein